MAKRINAAIIKSYAKGRFTPALVDTSCIGSAEGSEDPKPDILWAKGAKPLMFLRKWLGDRVSSTVSSDKGPIVCWKLTREAHVLRPGSPGILGCRTLSAGNFWRLWQEPTGA